MQRFTRKAALAATIFALATHFAYAVDLSQEVTFDIPPQRLASALLAFSQQAGVQVVIGREVGNQTTSGIKGKQSLNTALSRLLEGSTLKFTVVSDTTISVGTSRPEDPQSRNTAGEGTSGPDGAPASPKPVQAATAEAPSARNDPTNSAPKIEEVVVTAQKREERLQDVPVPVTAISTESLAQTSQLRLMDYYTQVPGLIVSPADYSSQLVAIRGITTGSNSGAGTPTTGIMIDDVPYGASTGNTPGFTVPDLDPGDLARLEVLRGPQGTLYGASSMGGLIKYVTVDPSVSGFSGRVELGANGVRNGDQVGYTLRGAANVPLSDDLAVRASAFTRLDPGYIDNPLLGIDGVNKDRASGARLAALWKPLDGLSIKLSGTYQQIKGDGTSDVTTAQNVIGQSRTLGDLEQGYIAGVGPYKRTAQAYSAVVKYDAGRAQLTSVTGYNISHVTDSIDYSQRLGGPGGFSDQVFGVLGAPIFEDIEYSRFSQELRLAAPLGTLFDSLLGLYYDRESASPQEQTVLATDPRTGAVAGTIYSVSFPSTYTEYSAFADLTWHATDRLDVQFGGRASSMKIALDDAASSGPLAGDGPYPVITPGSETRNHAFTYLVTPQFKFSSDQMFYGRFASGYRPGGPNTAPGAPSKYNPDKTNNYELGFKGSFLDGQVSIDTSVYYIDWQSVQLNLATADGFGFIGNAGSAKSQGIEFSVEWRPTRNLSLGAWIAYDDAKLTDWPASAQTACLAGLGPCAGSSARLPLSPRISGNLSAEQSFPLSGSFRGFVGGNVSYVGDRVGVFNFGPPYPPERQALPAYAKTDLRGGVENDAWRVSLYVNNVFDRRGLVSGGLGTDLPYSLYILQPRNIGVTLIRSF